MRFVRQPLTIHVINCDDRLRKIGDNTEKRKHGAMLPSTIRAIVCGSSNCGKINVLISLVGSPHGVSFENVYIYSKSLQQPKYQYLENLLSSIDYSKCVRISKSAILHSLITVTSFHRARRVQTQSSCSMTQLVISKIL